MHEVITALIPVLARGERHAIVALADAIGAPPAMVDTALRELEAHGLPLERDGDRVRSPAFEPLDRAEIQAHLDRATMPNAWSARAVAVTTSTSSDLLAEVRAGRIEQPVVLVAELQSAGRGRLGRTWHAAPGASLTASFALQIGRPLAALEGVTLACGLALHAVLSSHRVPAALKWPNDVVIAGRKLAGILVEAHRQAGATILVIGVGLNVLPRADHADLRSAGCAVLDRNRLTAELAIELAATIERFESGGFAPFAAAWNAVDAFRGRRVDLRAHGGGTVLRGVARGVDGTGALLLEVDGRVERQIAGDLSLRIAGCDVAA